MPRLIRLCKSVIFSSTLFYIFYLILNLSSKEENVQKPKMEFVAAESKKIDLNNFNRVLNYKHLQRNVFVYSSFVDLRNGNMGYRRIRIMALVKRKLSLQCSFKSDSSPAGSLLTNVSYYEMSENHSMRYKCFILSCEIPSTVNINQLKSFSLIADDFDDDYVNVSVSGVIPSVAPKNHKFNFTLCTPVLFGKKYSANYLIEFFEISKLLGVQHVYIYYYAEDLNEISRKVLTYYGNLGVATFIETKLPMNPKLIWNYGQLLVVQDCLYENMASSKFTLFYDLDEHFVPYTADNWNGLSSVLFKTSNQAAYLISSYYFPVKNISQGLVAPKYTVSSLYPDKKFTKCLTKPYMIFEMGIHHVSRVIQDHFVVERMDANVSAMHHFKSEQWYISNKRKNTRLAELIMSIEPKYYEVIHRLERQHIKV